MFNNVHRNESRRRGNAATLVVISLVALVGMTSLTVDVGMLYRARSEAQASADAAAMAGAWRLMAEARLKTQSEMNEVVDGARTTARDYAARNEVVNESPTVHTTEDLTVGRLDNPWDPNESISFGDSRRYNAVRVLVRRDEGRNGPIDLFFAGIFGQENADVSAEAFAAFHDQIAGFRPSPATGNADLLPFALHEDAWERLLAGTLTTGDNWAYNESNGAVSAGADTLLELNLYPGAGAGQLPPGSFGTIDIGGSDNSTSDISRQIVYGVSAADIEDLGFEFVLGSDGTLQINGDTGLSAAVKDALAAIIGKPRTIPLFSTVTGPGNNATFTITGFAGIRVMDVKLTGSMSSKRVIIQPAVVVDDSAVPAVPGEGDANSTYVYRPVELVR